MSRADRVREQLIEDGVIGKEDEHLDDLVTEVEFALYPPTHEGLTQSYGCLITNADIEGGNPISVEGCELSVVRQLADGLSSFCVKRSGVVSHVLSLDSLHAAENSLLNLRMSYGGLLVHRDLRERIRVFGESAIHMYVAGEWTSRPYSSKVIQRVRASVPQVETSVLSSALQFAFHVLSPENVGATLILWLEGCSDKPVGETDISPMGLSITEHTQPLKSLLSMHDGAAFVGPHGHVESIDNHLRFSDKSIELIPKHGGTRHTSAKRFTFDEPYCVAIVVSEDGPVSVFADGAKVTELRHFESGREAKAIRESLPERNLAVDSAVHLETCSSCGKLIDVEVVVIYGWKTRETGACPVCGEEVASANCWQINTRLVKRLGPDAEAEVFLENFW